jgi:DNA-binding transcriptional MocR family regulator
MAVILKDIEPPIMEVAKLGYAAVAVYSLLFQSAHRDRCYAQIAPNYRADTGGTTNWSHKAIADTLSMGKAKVIQATDALLDAGFIQVVARERSSTGSKHRVYRVTHPEHLEAQRLVLSLFDAPSSVRNKRIDAMKNPKPNDKPIEDYLQ